RPAPATTVASAGPMKTSEATLRCRSVLMPGIAVQYRTIAGAAGWRHVPERGYLQVAGRDRLSFLQALVTNDVGSLQPGQGAYAAWLTPQGRMISDLRLHVRPETVLAGVPASGAAALAVSLDRLIFSEDVTITDVSARMTTIAVAGGEASSVLARACSADTAALDRLVTWSHVDVDGGFIVRTDDTRLPCYELCLAVEHETDAAARLTAGGATQMSSELSTALRIDAGRPLFGIDMDTETIPLEAGLLDRAISTSKGCYVGQEVIIRVLHRGGGRVARKLVRVQVEGDAPQRDAKIFSADREIGFITSAADSPRLGAIALGYVHRDFAETGTAVDVDMGETRARAHVTSL